MQISVRYLNAKGKQLKDKGLVQHAVAVQVRKGIWYFHVAFRGMPRYPEIDAWGGHEEYDNILWIEIPKRPGSPPQTVPPTSTDYYYLELVFDGTEDRTRYDIYVNEEKDYFHGIAIDPKLVTKAWDAPRRR